MPLHHQTTATKAEPLRQGVGRLGVRLAQIAVPFIVLWFGFYACWRAFPYLETGSEVVYKTKLHAISKKRLLDPAAKYRVVIYGNSITLSGFIPERFDQLMGEGSNSYNMGLPERNDFMPVIRGMMTNGDVPTHLLLQVPWSTQLRPETFMERLRADDRIMNALFPFRKLPRDLAIFTILARQHGGFLSYYASKKTTAEQMLRDRGYYFIEGQSRYPGHRVPEGVTFGMDRPDKVRQRHVSTVSMVFNELEDLAETHDMQILLVPEYYRQNLLAEPPAHNTQVAKALAGHPHFFVLGPDYYRYENRYFSDAMHANQEGAEKYTKRIAGLFKAHIDRQAGTDRGGD